MVSIGSALGVIRVRQAMVADPEFGNFILLD
jgi:hypothetical protein